MHRPRAALPGAAARDDRAETVPGAGRALRIEDAAATTASVVRFLAG